MTLTADTPSGILIPKGTADQVQIEVTREDSIQAPVEAGTVLGNAVVSLDGKVLAEIPLRAADSIEKINFTFALCKLWELFTVSPFADR